MEQLSLYPDYRGVSHWHDDVEFIMMMDGQMTYDINGQSIDMQTGEGVFVNSRCLHYGYSDAHFI
ncbi:MAG: cupin domain-containing protein [Coprococcus sp.]